MFKYSCPVSDLNNNAERNEIEGLKESEHAVSIRQRKLAMITNRRMDTTNADIYEPSSSE